MASESSQTVQWRREQASEPVAARAAQVLQGFRQLASLGLELIDAFTGHARGIVGELLSSGCRVGFYPQSLDGCTKLPRLKDCAFGANEAVPLDPDKTGQFLGESRRLPRSRAYRLVSTTTTSSTTA